MKFLREMKAKYCGKWIAGYHFFTKRGHLKTGQIFFRNEDRVSVKSRVDFFLIKEEKQYW